MDALSIVVMLKDERRLKEELEDLVKRKYPDANLVFLEKCQDTNDSCDHADIVLINADKVPVTDKCRNCIKKMVSRNYRPPAVLMLTKNFSTEKFLRHQSYNVTDTVNIEKDLSLLEDAIDNFVAKEPDYGKSAYFANPRGLLIHGS